MKAYLLTVIAASLITSLVGILSPSGERGGLSKHTGLVTALFLVCILASPVKGALEQLLTWSDGDLPLPEGTQKEDYEELLGQSTELSSKRYFTQCLTETLQTQFGLDAGTVRCAVQWRETDGTASPSHVTVILSGSAIWKDPHAIEDYVRTLLDCECDVAVE
ncbi:MAG: hypothetical protein IJW29_04470 [Clostridia bacterium]|nr:hypothetical protein [Clostridia bacterium]